MIPTLVLASTSPYRKQLLDRLGLSYQTLSPSVDETARLGESAQTLVKRLAKAKALSVATHFPNALIIGSDQVAVLPHQSHRQGEILGKPGSHQAAVAQLRQASGKRVDFYTGLCVYNSRTQKIRRTVVPYHVTFRVLSDDLIEGYLLREKPYNCAGSFKSEGLGIVLFKRMQGKDPTALIGLPLIALRRLLQQEKFNIIERNCSLTPEVTVHSPPRRD